MPFTSEKQRRFMFAEHPRIAKRWAHEDPTGDEGLPTYAHKKTTSPEVKKAWEQSKGKRKEASMRELLIKLAAHADDRLKERTKLSPAVLQRLRARLATKQLPRGTHHSIFRDGSYAVLKDVGNKHVVATVLSRNMRPPGTDHSATLRKRAVLEKVALLLAK